MTDTLPPPRSPFGQFPRHFCLVLDLTFTFCACLPAWVPGGFSANYHHFWRAPKAISAESEFAIKFKFEAGGGGKESGRDYYIAINIICCFLSLVVALVW